MTRVRSILVASTMALALIGASTALRNHPIVIWNASTSVPIGFYAVTPIFQPTVGDLVAVRAPAPLEAWLVENGYLGRETPLLKPLAAEPGAEVCRDGLAVRINGRRVAEARKRDLLGRTIKPWIKHLEHLRP